MHKQVVANGRVLMIAALATLAPLTMARAEYNAEVGAFYTLNQEHGEAVAAKPGVAAARSGTADASAIAASAGPALNPELGSFYSLGRDLAKRADRKLRGAAGPVRADDYVYAEAPGWHPVNPEEGTFYNLSAMR